MYAALLALRAAAIWTLLSCWTVSDAALVVAAAATVIDVLTTTLETVVINQSARLVPAVHWELLIQSSVVGAVRLAAP